MVDLINFQHNGLDHVVDDQLEVGMPQPVRHILLSTSKHIVHHNHLVTSHHQSVYEVTAHKTGSTSNQDSHSFVVGNDLNWRETGCSGWFRNGLYITKNLATHFLSNNLFNLNMCERILCVFVV